MRSCAEFEALIDREHAGEELAAADRERLAEHLESCRSCDEMFDLMAELKGAPEPDAPSEEELARVRRGVHAGLARPATLRFPRRARLALPLTWAAALAGLAAGWLLAGAWRATPDADSGLVTELRRAAMRPASSGDGAGPPYRIRDVRLSPASGGSVRIAFDAARRIELEVDRDDPLLAELVVRAMLEEGAIGDRLAAIEAAPALADRKVRRALRVAMRHDPNLGVRLRAQEHLAALVGDDEVAAAMLEVLAREASIEMRFNAIDYLAGSGIAVDRLETTIRESNLAGERAVLLRAGRRLAPPPVEGEEF